MGQIRRQGKEVRSLPEVLAAELPVELNMLEFTSTTEGLRAELERVRSWLDSRVPGGGADLLGPVLDAVGFDVGRWYATTALVKPEVRPFRTTAPRECFGCRQIVDGNLFPDTLLDPDHPERSLCRDCAG